MANICYVWTSIYFHIVPYLYDGQPERPESMSLNLVRLKSLPLLIPEDMTLMISEGINLYGGTREYGSCETTLVRQEVLFMVRTIMRPIGLTQLRDQRV